VRVLDLFSGFGGFSRGLERAGMRTVGFVEIDPYCQRLLASRYPGVPIHGDITTRVFREGEADVVCGGFPCQDISLAGKRAGIAGARSGLYGELVRAIRLVRPLIAYVENVAALLADGMGRVLGDMAEIGYDAEWDCIPAAAVGAMHYRDRVWIQAYPDTHSMRPQRLRPHPSGAWTQQQLEGLVQAELRLSVPSGKSGGVVDGARHRKHRLTGLGNAVLPQIPEIIGRETLRAFNQ
jgi:DNA (cytosine-5)-methyltransferase 1